MTRGQRSTALFRLRAPVTVSRNKKCSATQLSNHTHTLAAIQAVRLCHCSHERIVCNYPFPAVYMWKMPQISTLSPLALNHLPSTSPSSRNKPHLGLSLHKRQTKSQPTAQCIPISMDRLCSCFVIVCFTRWKRWYFFCRVRDTFPYTWIGSNKVLANSVAFPFLPHPPPSES